MVTVDARPKLPEDEFDLEVQSTQQRKIKLFEPTGMVRPILKYENCSRLGRAFTRRFSFR